MKRLILALLIGFQFSPVIADDSATLQQVIAGHHRSAENKLRDQYRHPEATLNFFEVKPNMTVVEIWPGDGWYTEILAPYLKEQGKLYAAQFAADDTNTYHKDKLKSFTAKIKDNPTLYGKVAVTVLAPDKQLQIAPDGSADRVLTFRNVHNWMKHDQAAAVFKAMFKALKPGGMLGIVEHRGSLTKAQDPQAKSGYVTEDYVIALARNAGFEFLAKSEINANPKDTKDYPEGVWTLPPSLKLKDKDKAQYLAIGESDRMTLKFIKPQPTALAQFLPKLLSLNTDQPNLSVDIPVIHKSE